MIVLRRLASALPVIVGVIIVTFLLTRALPGDPAVYFAGPAASPQAIAEIRHRLGFDRSLPEQFLDYVDRLAHGDLGTSLTTGQPVATELLTRLPASAELTLLALILAVLIAIPLGIAAAMQPGSPVDHACRIITTAGVSLPTFFTGLLLVYVFYYLIGIAPAPLGRLDVYSYPPPDHTGFYLIDSLLAGDFETFRAALAQIILPASTMAIFTLAPLARITRAAEFANTNFSSNVGDLVAAADYLRQNHGPPSLLIGHSLGGAAVLAAAPHVPDATAVVAIGAPASAAHVSRATWRTSSRREPRKSRWRVAPSPSPDGSLMT
jgi:ABC-type dipeptide/oligopeptide/nickel transport system permease component